MSFKVIGLGEVLWDLLPSGPQLGGAPANFAYHAHALGARAQVITRVGNDQLGREILNRLEAMGLAGPTVQMDEAAPTGTVTVALTGNGIPEFTIHEAVAWDSIAATHSALAAVREADAICFGSLAQRGEISRNAIQRLVAAAPAAAWRIFDINLRQHFYNREIIEQSLKLANVLKLNDGELPVMAKMFGIEGLDRQVIEALAKRYSLQVVALTRGPEGSLLYRGGRWSEHGAGQVEIKDTVGAGDSFTAALCLGLLGQMDLDEINAAASQVAAFVCGCAGATPHLPDHLRQLFAHARRTTTPPIAASMVASP
jgi:fructokinase